MEYFNQQYSGNFTVPARNPMLRIRDKFSENILFIRDPRCGIRKELIPNPDPGVKKASDPD
jgi:hypothetical protein